MRERPRPFESLTVRVDSSVTTKHGVTLTALRAPRLRTPPGRVAQHEAAHIIAAQSAGGIALATIVGTSEYAGATWPVVMTAMAAMAAKADGHEGYGWDEFMTRFILGVDPDSAASSAASYLSSRHDYMYAVASKLEERRTIGQGDVDEAYQEVDDERQGNWDVAIHMQARDGQTHIYMRRSRGGEVTLPSEEIVSGEKGKEKEDDSTKAALGQQRSLGQQPQNGLRRRAEYASPRDER